MDLQTKGLGAFGHGLPDPAHTDNAKPLAINPTTQHPGWRPALEATILHHLGAFDYAPGRGQDQGHGHIGRVLGQDAGRIGDGNAAGIGGGDIDIVDPGAKIGDQFQALARTRQEPRIDSVGNGRHQDLGPLQGIEQGVRAHGLIAQIKLCVEQFAQARLHRVRQFARDDDFRLAGGHEAI